MRVKIKKPTIITSILILLQIKVSLAQKPLDYKLLEDFEMIGGAKISNNGDFAAYQYIKPNYYPALGAFNKPPKSQLFFQSATGNWKLCIPDIDEFNFTQDSRFGVFRQGNDSLGVLKLGSNDIHYYTDVEDWKMPNKGYTSFISLLKNSGQLSVLNMGVGKSFTFDKVFQYQFAPTNDVLVIADEKGLHWLDLVSETETLIYPGKISDLYHFNRSERELLFAVGKKGDRDFFIYHREINSVQKVLSENKISLFPDLELNGVEGFLCDSKSILLSFKRSNTENKDNYNNSRLSLDTYLGGLKPTRPIFVVANTASTKYVQLNDSGEELLKAEYADVWMVKDLDNRIRAVQWLNGSRKAFPEFERINDFGFQYWFSLSGKFIVYLNYNDRQYHSIELKTGMDRVISSGVNADWFGIGTAYQRETPDFNKLAVEPIRWYTDSENVLVKDRVGYWKLNLLGLESARPLLATGSGYRNIIFRTLNCSEQFDQNTEILASSQDTLTKGTGICKISSNGQRLFRNLVNVNTTFNIGWGSTGIQSHAFVPPVLKARDKEVYIFAKQTSIEPPNYFISSDDFKSSKQLSNIKADTNYNWPSRAELHHFERMDGGRGLGVLYKPKNFDPNKRYPLIMFYYERMSDGLNCFKQPDMPSEGIDVAWMVSHGYLVFVPDIFYKIGYTAKSVYDNLEGAARYVATLPFVNVSKLGMAGHSLGGYETNIMLTRSKRFAAAYSSAGPANISGPYDVYMAERGSYRMEKTLWDIPEQYIMSSPVFQADKVTTPVLFLGNTGDKTYTPHVLQFFHGLKRLGKLCWLMNYESGGHGMDWGNCRNYEDRKDHTTRVMQFFNHYLKEAPAPLWMLDHTQDTTLDKAGRTPQPQKLSEVEQKRVDDYGKIRLVDKLQRITN